MYICFQRRAEKIYARVKKHLDMETLESFRKCELLLHKALAICPLHASARLSAYYL